MADTSELKIITDETLMEKRTHGQSVFPFQYYLEDIWDFDFHTIGWHWHQEIEFIYVQSGEVQCYIGKDNFSLPAGSGLFINTKVIHQLTAKQTTLIPNIVFSPLLLASEESLIYQQYIKPVLTSDIDFLVFEPYTLWHKEILSLLNQIFETEKTTSKFTYQQQVLSLPQLCLSYSFCDTVMNKPSHANQFLLPGYGCYYIVVPIPFDRYTLIPLSRPR